METTQEQRSVLIAHDFITKNTSTLDQKEINAGVKTITAKTKSYPATASVVNSIFFSILQVKITGGKTFNGQVGGAVSLGASPLVGDVYTSDLNRLYSDTVSVQLTMTPIYTSFIFFDGSSNVLGTFQAGNIGTIAGLSSGSGSWS